MVAQDCTNAIGESFNLNEEHTDLLNNLFDENFDELFSLLSRRNAQNESILPI